MDSHFLFCTRACYKQYSYLLFSAPFSHRLWASSPSENQSILLLQAPLSLSFSPPLISQNRLIPFARPHFSQLCFFFLPPPSSLRRRRLEKKINLAARCVPRDHQWQNREREREREREAECGRCGGGIRPWTSPCFQQAFVRDHCNIYRVFTWQ